MNELLVLLQRLMAALLQAEAERDRLREEVEALKAAQNTQDGPTPSPVQGQSHP